MFRQGLAVGDEAHTVRAVREGFLGDPFLFEAVAANRIDHRAPVDGRKDKRHGGFGQPVTGRVALGAEPVRPEAIFEACQGIGENGLTGVDRHAPGAQVEPCKGRVGNFPRAEFKRKIRGGAERGAGIVHRPQPSFRTAQEVERRENGNRQRVIEAEEPGTDQSHVVIERQPSDADVGWFDLDGPSDAAHVGQDVRLRKDHAFRVARAARSVLNKCRIRWFAGHPQRRLPVFGKRLDRRNVGQARNAELQNPRYMLGGGEADQEADSGVAQDVRLPVDVLLNFIRACRGVDGNRNASCQHDTEEGIEKVVAGRQYDGDGFIAPQPSGLKTCGHAGGGFK